MDMIQGRMDLAVKYGADVAIFVHNIVYWVEKNAANGVNFYDGRYWTYNSASALCKLYPLWSKDQIKRLIKKCVDLGVILTGNYNENKRDRTQWYTPSDEILELYGLGKIALCKERNHTMEDADSPRPKSETAPPLPSIYQEDTKNTPYSPPEGDKAAPDKKLKRKRRASKSEPIWQAERFERFWAAYPRDEDRAKAVEQWDLLREDKSLAETYHGDEDAFLDEVARGLQRHLTCEDWKAGVAIPYAFRWLRDRRWTERKKTGKPDEVHRPMRPPRKSHIEIIEGEEVTVYDD